MGWSAALMTIDLTLRAVRERLHHSPRAMGRPAPERAPAAWFLA